MTWNTSAIVPLAMWVNIMMTWQLLLTQLFTDIAGGRGKGKGKGRQVREAWEP